MKLIVCSGSHREICFSGHPLLTICPLCQVIEEYSKDSIERDDVTDNLHKVIDNLRDKIKQLEDS